MKKLTPTQLARLRQELSRRQPHPALQAELLDHLATQTEQAMATGQDFERALSQVLQEASPQAVAQLKHTYQQAVPHRPAPSQTHRLASGRSRKRQLLTHHYPAWLRASLVAFITLMICLMWCSQLFAVPLGVFKNTWVVGLTSLLGVLCARLLFRFRPRSRRLRPRWT